MSCISSLPSSLPQLTLIPFLSMAHTSTSAGFFPPALSSHTQESPVWPHLSAHTSPCQTRKALRCFLHHNQSISQSRPVFHWLELTVYSVWTGVRNSESNHFWPPTNWEKKHSFLYLILYKNNISLALVKCSEDEGGKKYAYFPPSFLFVLILIRTYKCDLIQVAIIRKFWSRGGDYSNDLNSVNVGIKVLHVSIRSDSVEQHNPEYNKIIGLFRSCKGAVRVRVGRPRKVFQCGSDICQCHKALHCVKRKVVAAMCNYVSW